MRYAALRSAWSRRKTTKEASCPLAVARSTWPLIFGELPLARVSPERTPKPAMATASVAASPIILAKLSGALRCRRSRAPRAEARPRRRQSREAATHGRASAPVRARAQATAPRASDAGSARSDGGRSCPSLPRRRPRPAPVRSLAARAPVQAPALVPAPARSLRPALALALALARSLRPAPAPVPARAPPPVPAAARSPPVPARAPRAPPPAPAAPAGPPRALLRAARRPPPVPSTSAGAGRSARQTPPSRCRCRRTQPLPPRPRPVAVGRATARPSASVRSGRRRRVSAGPPRRLGAERLRARQARLQESGSFHAGRGRRSARRAP